MNQVYTTIENIFKVMAIKCFENGKILVSLFCEGDNEDKIRILILSVGQSSGQVGHSNWRTKLLDNFNCDISATFYLFRGLKIKNTF